ncbi:MAG: SDR family NAD(P)-dependent oxidoreductase [Bryobacteraceae bacterium]
MRWNNKGLMLAAAAAGALVAMNAGLRRNRHYDLSGRVVLITGGSRGLGLVLARQFADEGAQIAICARNAEELERAKEDLIERGAGAFTITADLTKRDQIEDMIQRVEERFGGIDVLVNNAGTMQVGPLEAMTIEDFEEAMQVHFWAPLYAMQAVLPSMRERGEGRIVNISSIGGKIAVPHMLPYCASKFALTGLSQGLRAELLKDGIHVTTVCPGLMRTGSPRNAYFKGRNEAEYAWFSVADSLPGLSMSAEKAASQIVNACKRGEAEVILGLPARAAVLFHGVLPGMAADLAGFVNTLLPPPGGIGEQRAHGYESESGASRTWLTPLSDEAARRNNQIR